MNKLKSLIMTTLLSSFLCSSYSYAGTLGQYTSNSDGFDTHTYFYDDGTEVVLIDTQFTPQLAKQFFEYVQSQTSSPITKVIVTHPNPDKFNGLPYLHDLGVQSISSKAVSEDMINVNQYKRNFWINQMQMFTKDNYPAFEEVQWQFSGKQGVIKLGSGETLSLHTLSQPAIATSQVVVKIDETGDLVVGDLVHHKAHAWLEGPLIDGKPRPMLNSWIISLNQLKSFSNNEALVYGGRGDIGTLQAVVDAQQNYLSQGDKLVENYVARMMKNKSTVSEEDIDELVIDFETAFPDYSLPYMIKYSIKPLVEQKLMEQKMATQTD